MPAEEALDLTRLLNRMEQGDGGAAQQVVRVLYDELHKQARRFMSHERVDHTLQATALVHDAFMSLIQPKGVSWKRRGAFLAAAAKAMRNTLIDHARSRARQKRGGGVERAHFEVLIEAFDPRPLDAESTLDLLDALDHLSRIYPRAADVINLRFLIGLSAPEIAEALDISCMTVQRDCRIARAWLREKLEATTCHGA